MWRSPGILIVGSDMCVRAIDSLTHNKIWKNPLTGCGPDGTVSLVQTDKRIYAGANGYVVCIDPETGSTLWKTSLSGTGVFGYFVSMHIRGNVLYAGCNGVLLALDLLSGNILWTDKLKGCSHGNVQICDFQNNMDLNAQPQLQALRAEMRTQEQAAATSATRNIPQ
jgi:outer membrane protein assembly factor BamB